MTLLINPMPAAPRLFLLLVGFFTTTAHAAESLEFIGYVKQDGTALFVLRETQSKATSGFVPLGRNFRGYTLESYDAAKSAVTLRHRDARLTLILLDAKVESADAAAVRKREAMHYSKRVQVTGAVREEGSMQPTETTAVGDAIAAMGGFQPNADLKAVVVGRPSPDKRAQGMHFLDCTTPAGLAFKLQPGDSLHVQGKGEP